MPLEWSSVGNKRHRLLRPAVILEGNTKMKRNSTGFYQNSSVEL